MAIVHFDFDTLPRVVPSAADSALDRGQGGAVDLVVPFRVDRPEACSLTRWALHAEVDGVRRTSTTRVVSAGFIAGLRRLTHNGGAFDFAALAPYLDMDTGIDAGSGAVYLEARVVRVRPGERVDYRLEVAVERPDGSAWTASSRTFSVWAVAPVFGGADIRRTFLPDISRPDDAWVLYHRRSDGFDHVRIDVVSLKDEHTHTGTGAGALLDLAVTIGGATFDLAATGATAGGTTGAAATLPMVDPATDSVVFSVPATGDRAPLVDVRFHGFTTRGVDPNVVENVGRARLAFVNFAIQGLNDYFVAPDSRYTPPRTYTQVTMRDEAATFSSRPGSPENGIGDGYAFTLDAHRRHGIKQMWAMNGGLAVLLAHDCAEDLELLRADVERGLVVPVIAGYGAHRLPYYSTATNTDAIRYGIAALDGTLGAHSNVYYPDSRVYAEAPHVTDALRAAGVEYLVLDAPGFDDGRPIGNLDARSPNPPMHATDATGRWLDFSSVWRDRTTGIKILFIDPELKDGLFGADDAVAERGKLPVALRRRFMQMATQPTARRTNLLVYGDDADKASGNGWFDGTDNQTPMNRNYQAALAWISRHPWVQAVTTDDLTDDDCVGTIDVRAACDPYITGSWAIGGLTPVAEHDYGIAFDGWYARWAPIRVPWLGESLVEITRRAEHRIAAWPVRNRMVDLARLYLTMSLHESQWSKITRAAAGTEPEDFVVAASIQLRNAHVYLAAAVWADWAAQAGAPEAYRDAGPVIERLAELDRALDQRFGTPAWRRADGHGLQWDHDPLCCVILYNPEVLVVIDRNGGRITHLFAMVGGLPCSVSGTFKAYQSLDVDWRTGAGRECDGGVLQNTVYSPNHAYVACDVASSRGSFGESPPGGGDVDWVYPDNLNAYDVLDGGGGGSDGEQDAPWVTLAYGAGTGEPAPTTRRGLDALLERDRGERLAGGRGVVLHDPDAFGDVRKTVRLDGRTVHIGYSGALPGHVVANEFCVDLWACTVNGRRQTRTVHPGGRVTLTTGAVSVEVVPGPGCELTAAAAAPLSPPTSATLRLHRVLTDDVEIVAPAGGAFRYSVTV